MDCNRSVRCSVHRRFRLRITRESDGRFKLFVNDTLVSKYRSGPPVDLRIGTISDGAFRIGSRFPPGGSEPRDPFAGTIRQAVLRVPLPLARQTHLLYLLLPRRQRLLDLQHPDPIIVFHILLED